MRTGLLVPYADLDGSPPDAVGCLVTGVIVVGSAFGWDSESALSPSSDSGWPNAFAGVDSAVGVGCWLGFEPGNAPDSSRRSSSGEMCGDVRRPGELRVEVVPSAVAAVLGAVNASRVAVRGLSLVGFSPARAVPVDWPAPLPVTAFDFCGKGVPRKPGRSISCIVAGSGGSEFVRGGAWPVAPLAAGERDADAFEGEVRPFAELPLLFDRFAVAG